MSSIENTSKQYLCLFDNYCIKVKTYFLYCCLSMLLSVDICNTLLLGHSFTTYLIALLK